MDTIEREAVRKYLDWAIRWWRRVRDNPASPEDELMASHYVDAYQSVRVSLLGELLPEEN